MGPRVDLGAYLSAAGEAALADTPTRTRSLRRCCAAIPGVPTGQELLHLVTSTAPAANELSFTQAVPRSSVHRHNATEVFLTEVRDRDTQPSDPTPVHRFAAAALLPVAHPHYSAHTGAANRVLDPMLLLECCRQAETYAAHAFYGVEPDAAFVLKSWSLSLLPGAFAARPDLDEPTRLVIGARTHGLRMVAGAARGLVQDFDLWVGERPVASARIEVGYLSRAAFTTLRARGRGTPPDVALYNPPKTEVAPWLVGRIRADDTLLLDLRGTADETTADLRLPTGNPSLLDHAHDHVPGTRARRARPANWPQSPSTGTAGCRRTRP